MQRFLLSVTNLLPFSSRVQLVLLLPTQLAPRELLYSASPGNSASSWEAPFIPGFMTFHDYLSLVLRSSRVFVPALSDQIAPGQRVNTFIQQSRY